MEETMRPPDALDGWDDDLNAELYAQFTHDYPLYGKTSRDLAARAGLSSALVAVDLCGGTGTTAAILLDAMPSQGRVISVDSAKAMQKTGQRILPGHRITWITATAESIADRINEPADAVVCNSAIWKTSTSVTFAAVKRILRPRGRFVFNVGGGFAGLAEPGSLRRPTKPSLNDLINSIAIADYGYVQRSRPTGPVLTPALLTEQLTNAGFTDIENEVIAYQGTVEEKRAWLSIPVFARPPGQLTYRQRMEILQKATARTDDSQVTITNWLIVEAKA
jgi:SAM-dependent methyltransferase